MRGLPDFMIIGASRCGTTSLHAYLTLHDGVEGPKYLSNLNSKELHFFDHTYEAGIHWYHDQFHQPQSNGKLYCEATPDYLFEPYVPTRVKKWLPDCKFIVMLRDPVDRAWSHFYFYWMGLYGCNLKLLYKAIKEVKVADREVQKMPFRPHSYYRLLQMGMYAKSLKRWFRFFPKEQFCILQSEKFFLDPAEETREVCKWLGVEEMSLSTYPIIDPLKNVGGNPYPRIPEMLERRLRDYYRPLNEELYELVGQDFGWRK